MTCDIRLIGFVGQHSYGIADRGHPPGLRGGVLGIIEVIEVLARLCASAWEGSRSAAVREYALGAVQGECFPAIHHLAIDQTVVVMDVRPKAGRKVRI